MLLEENDYIFVHVIFTGKSWVQGGHIMTDLGHGNFNIENKIRHICGGGINIAVWFFMNCSRFVKVKEAGSQEWDFENEDESSPIKAVKGPLLMIYACAEGVEFVDYVQAENNII